MLKVQIEYGLISIAAVAAIAIGVYISNPSYWQSYFYSAEAVSIKGFETGEAFEVIEPKSPESVFENKSPQELKRLAEEIVVSADRIVKKYNLTQIEMTDEKRIHINERVVDIQSKIEQIEKQLK